MASVSWTSVLLTCKDSNIESVQIGDESGTTARISFRWRATVVA